MPRIFTAANTNCIAHIVENGYDRWQSIPYGYTDIEAEYLGIIYSLNEYFLKWNEELDSRQYNMSIESGGEFYKVASPSEETPRPLPPPVQICCDNELVVKQLSRQYHIGNERIKKLAQQVWQMTQNVDVKYEWVSRKDNPAGKMLK